MCVVAHACSLRYMLAFCSASELLYMKRDAVTDCMSFLCLAHVLVSLSFLLSAISDCNTIIGVVMTRINNHLGIILNFLHI